MTSSRTLVEVEIIAEVVDAHRVKPEAFQGCQRFRYREERCVLSPWRLTAAGEELSDFVLDSLMDLLLPHLRRSFEGRQAVDTGSDRVNAETSGTGHLHAIPSLFDLYIVTPSCGPDTPRGMNDRMCTQPIRKATLASVRMAYPGVDSSSPPWPAPGERAGARNVEAICSTERHAECWMPPKAANFEFSENPLPVTAGSFFGDAAIVKRQTTKHTDSHLRTRTWML